MSASSVGDSLFDRIRSACAEVARRAAAIRIDDDGLESLAGLLTRERQPMPGIDPAHHHLGDPAATVAFVITLNAVNFGSGYFPHLRKRPGLSGYLTVSTWLRERFASGGPWSAEALLRLTAADCARVFGQDPEPVADELMGLFARALRDLGHFLLQHHGGRFEGPVEAAAGSAERLVHQLARMEFYRDVARYRDLEVPFYKRAQITCLDLATALGGKGLGRFSDLDQLTLFADNLVPHLLRMLGVLVYDPGLVRRIDAGELIESQGVEEVEIRAVALHAVERLSESCARRGFEVRPHELDGILWTLGQRPDIKARPRHRTRCTFY
jgi:hypothetical protein